MLSQPQQQTIASPIIWYSSATTRWTADSGPTSGQIKKEKQLHGDSRFVVNRHCSSCKTSYSNNLLLKCDPLLGYMSLINAIGKYCRRINEDSSFCLIQVHESVNSAHDLNVIDSSLSATVLVPGPSTKLRIWKLFSIHVLVR